MNSYQFEDLISDYLENTLSISKRKKFETFLKNEIGAKEKVAQVKQNMIILGSLNQVTVSEKFNDDLMIKIKTDSSKGKYLFSSKNGYLLGLRPFKASVFLGLIILSLFLTQELYNEIFTNYDKSSSSLSKDIVKNENLSEPELNQIDSLKIKENKKDKFSKNIRLVND
jgi:hypothetical protein